MTAEIPEEIKNDFDVLYAGCISGATSVDELKTMLTQSGFQDVVVEL